MRERKSVGKGRAPGADCERGTRHTAHTQPLPFLSSLRCLPDYCYSLHSLPSADLPACLAKLLAGCERRKQTRRALRRGISPGNPNERVRLGFVSLTREQLVCR